MFGLKFFIIKMLFVVEKINFQVVNLRFGLLVYNKQEEIIMNIREKVYIFK